MSDSNRQQSTSELWIPDPVRSKTFVPCFTPGTLIATPRGETRVEDLIVGTRIITRDSGIKHISWVGHKKLTTEALEASPAIRPIVIQAGALGNGLPERDMSVSPFHRMLVVSEVARKHFDEAEVLVYAKDLIVLEGVSVSNPSAATYVHFMCEDHEAVLANGSWTETFQPSDYAMQGVEEDQRKELFRLFPELATMEGLKKYRAARKTLNKNETKRLFRS
ncbi:Hint domain-containing protein [Loktanella sp. S4079]|uniref:Hint domain-containing protein n=1 Tax=Loktanella sp. S4079 TaxID=579483 RepID=UPI0006967B74|nr:Hint domain-containing protein [Loktanella sp. S4079]